MSGAKPLKMAKVMLPKQNLKRKKVTDVPWVDVDSIGCPPELQNQSRKKRKLQNTSSHVNGHTFLDSGTSQPDSPPPSHHDPSQTSPSSSTSTPFSKGRKNSENRKALLQEQRRQLPIASGKDAILDEINRNDVTIIVGETGSGKTTQVPQYILESDNFGKNSVVAITQPRRVAATTLAERVSQEQDAKLGDLVGYSVRFDERASASTRIKYLTDGMIVREMLSDPLLNKYSVIIVDEAHERHLTTDLLLANLKDVIVKRNSSTSVSRLEKGKRKTNPLKVVIMSATLDAAKFEAFFPGSKILYVKGRQHPVQIFYTAQPQADYIQSAMRTFFQIHAEQPEGDVLIFLPGQEDIESLESSIRLFAQRLPKDVKTVQLCTMFAAQAHGRTAKAFEPAPVNSRKCILATNVAETSITIPGVKYVIDTGKCKENRYLTGKTGNGLDTLLTHDITKSSAMQRSGRAGREGPGSCYRLYTEEAFKKMALSPQPEILRVNLAASMLELKALGFDVEKLDLMDKPNDTAVRAALVNLWLLRAVDKQLTLTPLGRKMATLPLDPKYSCALLASQEYGCVAEVIDIISVLSASSKLFHSSSSGTAAGQDDQRERISESRSKFSSLQGDHCRVLNIFRAYEEICEQQESGRGHDDEGVPSLNVSNRKKKDNNRRQRMEWCHQHWLNERALTEARDIREQLRKHCSRMSPPVDWEKSVRNEAVDDVEMRELKIVKALTHGLVDNSAVIQPDGSYKQLLSQTLIKIHPSSVLANKKVPAIVFDELVFTNNIYARGVSMVPKQHLLSLVQLKQISS